MIKIDTMDQPRATVITVAGPLTALGYELARDQLHALPTGQLERVLLEVESIAIAEPKAVWEDLKLAPLVRHMKQVAVVTDLEWYGRLSRAFGAVWPGLEIAHFEPFDRESAVDWLATFDD